MEYVPGTVAGDLTFLPPEHHVICGSSKSVYLPLPAGFSHRSRKRIVFKPGSCATGSRFWNCNRDHDRDQKQIQNNREPIFISESDRDLDRKIDQRFSDQNRAAIGKRFFDRDYWRNVKSDPDFFVEFDTRFWS